MPSRLQTFQFDLSIARLPRFAKLCLAVHSGGGAGGSSRGQQLCPLFWVNTNVFDHKAKMKATSTRYMWPYTQVGRGLVIKVIT